MKKVCFARVDRIGDLVLTLPVEKMWLQSEPNWEITWLVHDNLQFVTNHVESSSQFLYLSPVNGFVPQVKEAFRLSKIIRQKNFDTFVAFHIPWWVALAAFLARVKDRVGPASQWFSWVFFNRRLRQKRSQSIKHESMYNAEILQFAQRTSGALEVSPAKLLPQSTLTSFWQQELLNKKVNLKKMVVIHAGMAGSARNWPAAYYRSLGQQLLDLDYSVVLTGSAADEAQVKATGLMSLPQVINLVGQTSGDEILSVLSLARVVVAPSTGVAHLAASVGVRTVGLYSPVKVQAPTRWAPIGSDVKVLQPQVDCPGERQCLFDQCPLYDCMSQISVDSVLESVIGN